MPNQTIAQWLQTLQIPWLFQDEVGSADARAWGGYSDQAVNLLKSAVLARFPSSAPSDALPQIGHDSELIQGFAETDSSFRVRLNDRWNSHARRGQPAEMLAQLWYYGFDNGVIVTQNGLAYSLSAAPTPGQDPTALLVTTQLGTLPTDATLAPTPQREPVSVVGSASPAGTRVINAKTIPTGNSWWTFDSRTDLCNRFGLLFPSGAAAFLTYGVATFSGTDAATVTWNNPNRFADTSYLTHVGTPVVTSGSAPASIYEDSSGRTKTGTTIAASTPWTGTVVVIAWPAGASPFCNLSDSDLSALRTLIDRWKPATTRCMGAWAKQSGLQWGYPPTMKWGDPGLVWGGVVNFFGVD